MKTRTIFIILLLAILSSCVRKPEDIDSLKTTTQLVAEEILHDNPDADLIILNDRVYEYTNSKEYTSIVPGKKAGIISDEYFTNKRLTNGVATKLPKGTVIYFPEHNSKTDLVLVDLNNRYVFYLGKSEG